MTIASNLLNRLQEAAVSAPTKPIRLCLDCLNDAIDLDDKFHGKPLTRNEVETLKWKCGGKGCYNKAGFSADAEQYDKIRRSKKMLEQKKQ